MTSGGALVTAGRHADSPGPPSAAPPDLRLPALQLTQPGGPVYSFAVEGKLLSAVTDVSRVRRGGDGALSGYQRPEAAAHVAAIRRYLESGAAQLPNALVVAFDSRVRFEPADGLPETAYARHGTLVVPAVTDPKPGWFVDGQQRNAAIREARISSFPVFVGAIITDSAEEQRSQFLRVNATKPLPRSLVYELLPATAGTLPPALQGRRFPAALLARLNGEERSPLQGMIKTTTNPEGIIQDNSILSMLARSLSDGALYAYRDPRTGEADAAGEEAMMTLLVDFWAAVRDVFADAWGLPPRRSRLVHGAGVAGLGFLMDAIYDRRAPARVPGKDDFADDLTAIRGDCRWTSGCWDFGPGQPRSWNQLQNTTGDIRLLADYLLLAYKNRLWRTPPGPGRAAS